MAFVVKILTHDDGTENTNKRWCLAVQEAGTSVTLCEGECFGIGDSGCTYKTKKLTKGSITCEECRQKIKWFKSITL